MAKSPFTPPWRAKISRTLQYSKHCTLSQPHQYLRIISSLTCPLVGVNPPWALAEIHFSHRLLGQKRFVVKIQATGTWQAILRDDHTLLDGPLSKSLRVLYVGDGLFREYQDTQNELKADNKPFKVAPLLDVGLMEHIRSCQQLSYYSRHTTTTCAAIDLRNRKHSILFGSSFSFLRRSSRSREWLTLAEPKHPEGYTPL